MLAEILAFLWWRHDADKAEAKAEVAETKSVAAQAEIQQVAKRDAPRAWAAFVDEWKEQ